MGASDPRNATLPPVSGEERIAWATDRVVVAARQLVQDGGGSIRLVALRARLAELDSANEYARTHARRPQRTHPYLCRCRHRRDRHIADRGRCTFASCSCRRYHTATENDDE